MKSTTLKNQRGGLDMILIAVVAVVAIGGLAYYLVQNRAATSESGATKVTASAPSAIQSDTDAAAVDSSVTSADSSDLNSDVPTSTDLGL